MAHINLEKYDLAVRVKLVCTPPFVFAKFVLSPSPRLPTTTKDR